MLSVFLVNSNSQWVRWGNGCDRWLDGHLQHERNTKQNNRGFIHFPLVFSSTKQLFKTFQGAQNQTTLTNQVGILTGAKLQGSVCALLVKSKVHRSVHNLIRFFLLRIQWMMENKCSGCSDFVLHSRKQLKWFTEQIHMLTHTHTKKVIKSQLKSYHTAWSSLLFATVIIFTLPLSLSFPSPCVNIMWALCINVTSSLKHKQKTRLRHAVDSSKQLLRRQQRLFWDDMLNL